MQINKFSNLGWVVAAALGGILVGGGFQGSTLKFGVADVSQIITDSDYGKANTDALKKMQTDRSDLMAYLDAHRVATQEQITQLHDLWLKTAPTAEDTATLARIKADVEASDKKSKELSLKPAPTAEDRQLMDEYGRRAALADQTLQRWSQTFRNEVDDALRDRQLEAVKRVRAAISQVGKAQGYTIVFDIGLAPFGANDVTADSLKQMNATK